MNQESGKDQAFHEAIKFMGIISTTKAFNSLNVYSVAIDLAFIAIIKKSSYSSMFAIYQQVILLTI